MMTSSKGNIFRFTDPLWREPSVTGVLPPQRPATRRFDVFLIRAWINERNAGDLSRHRVHYGITVMIIWKRFPHSWPYVRGIPRSSADPPPYNRPSMWSLDICFMGINTPLNKLLSCQWFEKAWSSCDVNLMFFRVFFAIYDYRKLPIVGLMPDAELMKYGTQRQLKIFIYFSNPIFTNPCDSILYNLYGIGQRVSTELRIQS